MVIDFSKYRDEKSKLNSAEVRSADLVLQENVVGKDVYDDLTGELLPADLVTKPKVGELLKSTAEEFGRRDLFQNVGMQMEQHLSQYVGWW